MSRPDAPTRRRRCARRGANGHEHRMRLYPDIPARRLRTVVRDLLVVVLIVCFALIGLWVHDVVDKLAVLGEGVRKVGDAVPFGAGDPVEDLGRSGEERVLDGGDPRLVAMRAAFSLPYGTLLAYTEDPLGDLRRERYDALLAAAFEEAGLRG